MSPSRRAAFVEASERDSACDVVGFAFPQPQSSKLRVKAVVRAILMALLLWRSVHRSELSLSPPRSHTGSAQSRRGLRYRPALFRYRPSAHRGIRGSLPLRGDTSTP